MDLAAILGSFKGEPNYFLHTPALEMQQKISLIIIDFKNITPPTAPPMLKAETTSVPIRAAAATTRKNSRQNVAVAPSDLHA